MANKLYWGLQTVYNHASFAAEWARLTTSAGSAPSIATIGGQQWTAVNPTFAAVQDVADDILSRGAYPILDWFTSASATPPAAFCNPAIIAGAQDQYITAWAAAAAAWGKPIILCFAFEMNGGWYPAYSDIAKAQGNYPGSHRAMWQHVHDIFTAQGATNVVWLWVVNNQSKDGSGSATAETTQPLSQFWPGRKYVDLAGMDAFNYAGGGSGQATAGGTAWASLEQIISTGSGNGDTWARLVALDPDVPLCIASFGCDSREGRDTNPNWATAPIVNGTKKAQWFTDFAAMLKNPKYARLALWRYYNVDHASKGPPYPDGYSLQQGDDSIDSPTLAAVGGPHVSPVSGKTMIYSVVGGGEPLTAFRALVADTNHLKGGAFPLIMSGKLAIPYDEVLVLTKQLADATAAAVVANAAAATSQADASAAQAALTTSQADLAAAQTDLAASQAEVAALTAEADKHRATAEQVTTALDTLRDDAAQPPSTAPST